MSADGDPPDEAPADAPRIGPRDLAAQAVPEEVRPQASGSIEVPLGDPGEGDTGEGDTGSAPAVAAALPTARRRRATTASVITDHVVQAADRVATVADRVGGKVGDVIGESLTHLPGVPRTRRGRVLARGVLVGFCLVFAWISVIVGLQLRGRRPPDFRPDAERVFVELRDGQFAKVYDEASARFQEVVLEDTFVAQMTDLNQSLGKFHEVDSVISTEVNRGPGGRTGKVELRLAFDRAATRGSVSFRWEDEQWKLLGLSVEVPPALLAEVGTEEARRNRVAGNKTELRELVTAVLTRSFGGDVDGTFADLAPSFKSSMDIDDFRRTEADRRRTLGAFHRVLNVTSARISPSQSNTSIDCLLEFDNATINGRFKFQKVDGTWRLTYYKLVLPLPRVPS